MQIDLSDSIQPQNKGLRILSYDRKTLTPDLYESIGIKRSIIMHDDAVLAYSPPKAVAQSIASNASVKRIVAEEFVDGILVNVAWLESEKRWVIATRKVIGGTNHFYNNGEDKAPIIRDLFDDTCQKIGFSLDSLDRGLSYSFVMRHPKCRIVLNCDKPSLTIIQIYKISGTRAELVTRSAMESSCILHPQTYSIADSSDYSRRPTIPSSAVDKFVTDVTDQHMPSDDAYFGPGIMFAVQTEDGSYMRFKVRNAAYQTVKMLRDGNESIWRLDQNWLRLNKLNLLKEYLVHYPEDRWMMNRVRHRYEALIGAAYAFWHMVNITHTLDATRLPAKYKRIVRWIQELRHSERGIRVSVNHVHKIVGNLDTNQVLYYLNYNKCREPTAEDADMCETLEYFVGRNIRGFEVALYKDVHQKYNTICRIILKSANIRSGEGFELAPQMKSHCGIHELSEHTKNLKAFQEYLDWYYPTANFEMFMNIM